MTTVIGDFVEHANLKIFNDELLEHESKLDQEGYDAEDFQDNWPIDLEEYTLMDEATMKRLTNASLEEQNANIEEDEKIWRIKSLRVSVDEDTKILLLPLPESKRSKRLYETRYTLSTYRDLLDPYQEAIKQGEVDTPMPSGRRYEDLTQEEMLEEAGRKRNA